MVLYELRKNYPKKSTPISQNQNVRIYTEVKEKGYKKKSFLFKWDQIVPFFVFY